MTIREEIEKGAAKYQIDDPNFCGVDTAQYHSFKAGALFALKLAKEKGWLKIHPTGCPYWNPPVKDCTCGLSEALEIVEGK